MHIPNRSTGRKYIFHDAVLSLAARWTGRPAIFVGDTNTGWPDLDEEVPCFGPREEAFLSPALLSRLKSATHEWGGGRSARLSDHAALLVDLLDAG
jgi:hypothetical protein